MASLRLPFVVTVGISTLACGASACGGSATVEPDSEGGATGSGGAGTGNGSGNNGGAGTAGGGTGNVGGDTGTCPPSNPEPFAQCDDGSVCTYDVACESGPVALTFVCESSYWTIAPQPCDQPFDHCDGTEYYCDDQWWMPTGTNPPSPCPPELPEAGTACTPGGMGGVWENCGYDVGDECWIVATCVSPDPGFEGAWQHNGSCLPI